MASPRDLLTQAKAQIKEAVPAEIEPLLGQVTAHFALVRFTRMLGTLVGAGVSLVASLRTAREAIGNETLADTVSHAIEQVQVIVVPTVIRRAADVHRAAVIGHDHSVLFQRRQNHLIGRRESAYVEAGLQTHPHAHGRSIRVR